MVAAARKPRALPSDALFRAAADQAPHVMWIINAKGAVTYLNHSWYELVGGTPPQWHGHDWMQAVDPGDVAQMQERWKESSRTGNVFEGMRRVKARDGSWHTLSYKATPVFDENGLACWVGMDSDITEMVAAQAALRFANQELAAFAHTVSHDLRTPLVTVQGFAKMLARELDGLAHAGAKHYLDRITTAVQHMDHLVDGLLVLSDVTRRKLKMQEVDLSTAATAILERLSRSEPGRAASHEVQAGLVTHGDSRLVAALLENLLGNAWKFTSKTPRAHICVALASRTTAENVFVVKDNGVGFDAASAKNLFMAFERLHTADEFPGTGIGLATVQRVVTRHGGRVWAESELGKGSSFYFSLPA